MVKPHNKLREFGADDLCRGRLVEIAAGGFAEKAQAAADTGVQLIVIRRPAETGETADQILTRCREVLKG